MFRSFGKALMLYKNNIRWILLLGVTIVLPIQIIFTFLANYMALPFDLFQIPLWPRLFQIIFMLIAVFLMQPAFISMVVQDHRLGEIRISKVYGDALEYAFSVYIVGIVYAILTAAGMLLLFIPGLLLLIGFMGIPCAAVMDDLRWWKGIKRAAKFGKSYFFKLLGIIVLFLVIDALVSGIAFTLAYFLTTLTVGINIALMVVNILLMPLFILTITYLYYEWKKEYGVAERMPLELFQHRTV